MKQDITKEIEIPQDVSIELNDSNVNVKGVKGELRRAFPHEIIKISKQDNKLIIGAKKATKREKKMIGTICAHIKNMIKGVKEVFQYKLQICSVHFPMSVHIDAAKKIVGIKNFLGEVKERKATILDNVDVKIEGDIITVTSADKEAAGQTALNIENTTRIRARDRRVFQDGIFITEKAGEKI
jgi:large subunit ribosomal protein L6